MKLLRDQLSESVGKQEEDDAKIKEFNVGVSVMYMQCASVILLVVI